MGIAPVITDGDLVLGESGAICDYICARYGGGRLTPKPADPDFADHLFWFHWSNGTFMATHDDAARAGARDRSDNRGRGLRRGPHPARLGDDRGQARQSAEFFGGATLTTADIMMVYCLTTGRGMRGNIARSMASPTCKAYLKRIGGRPAYQRAMAKAGPEMAPMLG